MKEIDAKAIFQAYRSDLPNGSQTAQAIDRGAGVEDIAALAAAEGIHSLAGALFELLEENIHATADDGTDTSPVLEGLADRIREFRKQLPSGSKTAAAIDAGAALEEISQSAEAEGLFSFAAMLAEAERESQP